MPFNSILTTDSIDEKVDRLNQYICEMFNVFAPLKTFSMKSNSAPWLSFATKKLIKVRDGALRDFKNNRSSAKWDYYRMLRNLTTKTIKLEKVAYFKHLLGGNNKKQLWLNLKRNNIVRTKVRDIPESLCNPNAFNDYLLSNIPNCDIVKADLEKFYPKNVHKSNYFSFKRIQNADIQNAIASIHSNAMGHDGINLRMLILCTPHIIPHLKNIINSCIDKSYFPKVWKIAKIGPLPKTAEIKNYSQLRPISVLPTISKIFERVLYDQIYKFVETENILPYTQSGFRKRYSCTTALLKVVDDIRYSQDNNMDTVMVALDLTKAFDSLNPSAMQIILEYWGFGTSARLLINSYLNDRLQFVEIQGRKSDMKQIGIGVPQGSILGPLLFIIYTSKLYSSIKQFSVHTYADDVQIYSGFKSCDFQNTTDILNTEISNFLYWTNLHGLVVNPSKSQIIQFSGNKTTNISDKLITVVVNGQLLKPAKCIKNLGILMDNNLQFKQHVNQLIRNAYFSLKQLFGSRHILDKYIKKEICQSIVLSCSQFAGAVYGPCITSDDKRRIQVVQNSCVRFVCGIKRHDHISTARRDLNWLDMESTRYMHSVCLYHKVLTSNKPPYLREKVKYLSETHNKNVRQQNLLLIPRHNKQIFKRSFSYQAAHTLNNLSYQLKCKSENNFRAEIKLRLLNNSLN